MIDEPEWRLKFRRELDQAEQARKAGKEGMARVCARRAAAAAVRAFYAGRKQASAQRSGLAALRSLAVDPTVDKEVRSLANHFSLTINFEHELPPGVDLLADALALKKALFRGAGENEIRAATSHPEEQTG